MNPASWTLFIVSAMILPLHNVGMPIESEDAVIKCQDSIFNSEVLVRKWRDKMKEIHSTLERYDILNTKFEATVFQNQVNSFTTLVNNQLAEASDLKKSLAIHETLMNDSLSRQEDQLSKWEPQLLHLEYQWRNQSSEVEQLKQLWSDLGNKSVARAAEVQALDLSIKGLEDRLTQQEAKVEEKELAADNLMESLEAAEDTLKGVQDNLLEALNKQGRLEGALVTLQKEITEFRARDGGAAAKPNVTQSCQSQADSLCGRMAG